MHTHTHHHYIIIIIGLRHTKFGKGETPLIILVNERKSGIYNNIVYRKILSSSQTHTPMHYLLLYFTSLIFTLFSLSFSSLHAFTWCLSFSLSSLSLSLIMFLLLLFLGYYYYIFIFSFFNIIILYFQ